MKRIYDNAIDKNVAKVLLYIGSDGKVYYTDPEVDENAKEVPAEEALNLFLKEVVGFKSSEGTYFAPKSCTEDGQISFEGSGGGSGVGAGVYAVPGDYMYGDVLDPDILRKVNEVLYSANNGVVFIQVTGNPVFIGGMDGFWNIEGNSLSINPMTGEITSGDEPGGSDDGDDGVS